MKLALLSTLLGFCCLLQHAAAMHIHTTVSTTDPITYLNKFCFDQGADTGYMWGDVRPTTAAVAQTSAFNGAFVFVNDDLWATLGGMTDCAKIVNQIRDWENNDIPYLHWCAPFSNNRTAPANCYAVPPFTEPKANIVNEYSAYTRSRFWYASLVACDFSTATPSAGGVHGVVDVWVVNGNPNVVSHDYFMYQFSFEYQGALGLFVAYFVLYIVLVSAHVFVHLRSGGFAGMPLFVRLASAAMFLEFLAVLANLIHFGQYSQDGEGVPGMHAFGFFLQIISQCVLMLLLLLFAKGWSSPPSSGAKRRLMLGLFGGYSLLFIVLFIWIEAGQDPQSLLNEYQTWPGALILTLRCLILVWFIYELLRTYRKEVNSDTLSFYRRFGAFFVVWFVALPLIVIAAAIVDPRWRYKTINGCFYTLNFVSFAFLAFLLSPSRSSKYFKLDQAHDDEDTSDSSALPYDSI
ncbi:hypothetical protein CAOG_03088 [Capsaspora owczarzaki ATCC 30864]|uniref:GPR180/TMEM145 transmembrane domain-containing protein n=1 Tax=Capsaspora owczarzaki (strain ATCC 30864) TaxID=595528 RepID=A0A0D2WMJ3_CAPO3|nr:hypothetical protein CAOG_03088 [Capsaspora owczarzaki ATCC 30864]KJE92060.1 hypothetical protein CAOG_003088 [Capsaspora owczarzaki ATCC 30864]|eukprot:XP_004363927.1 hypothetical protein CAOG_03088 [Capsaspora owczarzaki ATCC 30864]